MDIRARIEQGEVVCEDCTQPVTLRDEQSGSVHAPLFILCTPCQDIRLARWDSK